RNELTLRATRCSGARTRTGLDQPLLVDRAERPATRRSPAVAEGLRRSVLAGLELTVQLDGELRPDGASAGLQEDAALARGDARLGLEDLVLARLEKRPAGRMRLGALEEVQLHELAQIGR